MTTAELIKTLADLGHPGFTATCKRPRGFAGFEAGARMATGRTPQSVAATDGAVLVCAVIRPTTPHYTVEVALGPYSGDELPEVMARAGVTP